MFPFYTGWATIHLNMNVSGSSHQNKSYWTFIGWNENMIFKTSHKFAIEGLLVSVVCLFFHPAWNSKARILVSFQPLEGMKNNEILFWKLPQRCHLKSTFLRKQISCKMERNICKLYSYLLGSVWGCISELRRRRRWAVNMGRHRTTSTVYRQNNVKICLTSRSFEAN